MKRWAKRVQMDGKAAHVELSIQDLRLMYVARMIWSAHMAKLKQRIVPSNDLTQRKHRTKNLFSNACILKPETGNK